MIDGSERDIFQLQFPRELTPVTPGVHRGDTRNEKKERGERGVRFSLSKKEVNILTRIPLAPGTRSGKLGTSIKLAPTQRQTDRTSVERSNW